MRLLAALLGLVLVALVAPAPAYALVDIKVDLSTQTMTVSSDTGSTFVWPVSSARAGYVTPRGTYKPQRLARMHYSKKYHMSPMPHSIFFRGGYAIHGTNEARNLGRPASHGCVRIAKANAAILYALVAREGATITIDGTPPHRTAVAAHAKPKASRMAKAGSVRLPASPAPGIGALGYAPAPADTAFPAWPLR